MPQQTKLRFLYTFKLEREEKDWKKK